MSSKQTICIQVIEWFKTDFLEQIDKGNSSLKKNK